MNEDTSHTCAQCRGDIHLGVNVWQLTEGVLGHRSFVPLEDPILLCSDECARKYFDEHPVYSLPRKVP